MEKFDINDFVPLRVFKESRNYVAMGLWRGRRVVVKEFRKATWANHIIYTFFRKSKACRAYRNAILLIKNGFHTPRPVSWTDEKRFGLYIRSIYVCEYIEGPTLSQASQELHSSDLPHLLSLYAETLFSMADKELLLKDSNLSNYIVGKTDSGKERLFMVDINRLVSGKKITPIEMLHTFGRSGWSMSDFNALVAMYGMRFGVDMAPIIKQYNRQCRRKKLLRKSKKVFKRFLFGIRHRNVGKS